LYQQNGGAAMKQLWCGLVCLFAISLVSSAAVASIPNAENSDTPDCFAMCPASDICQTITVRDQNNNPMPNTEVRLEFSASCDAVICWCPGQDHPIVTGMTDGSGVVTFCVDAGGCCDDTPYAVQVVAEPGAVELKLYESIASPDNHSDTTGNGDCDVDLNDFVVFSAMFLTDNCCGNIIDEDQYDGVCDCNVNLNDFVGFSAHFLHVCP